MTELFKDYSNPLPALHRLYCGGPRQRAYPTLSKGAEGSLLTEDAKAAIKRLQK